MLGLGRFVSIKEANKRRKTTVIEPINKSDNCPPSVGIIPQKNNPTNKIKIKLYADLRKQTRFYTLFYT